MFAREEHTTTGHTFTNKTHSKFPEMDLAQPCDLKTKSYKKCQHYRTIIYSNNITGPWPKFLDNKMRRYL